MCASPRRIVSSRRVPAAAATSSARRVAGGSTSTAAANARSTPVPGRSGSSSGSRPASCAGESSPGISSSASGFPWAVATSRSATPGRDRGIQQRPRLLLGERLDRQPLQPRHRHLRTVLARRGDHRHALLMQPPPGEQERVQRRLVQPLRVVDDHQHGPVLGRPREQREKPRGHREPVGRGGRPERQRTLERRGLHGRDLVEVREQRHHELGQPRERDVGLRLHPAHPEHREVLRLLDRVAKELRLADPRRPVQQHRATAPFTRGIDERLQTASLILAADHCGKSMWDGRTASRAVSRASRGPACAAGFAPVLTDSP